jgi:hypothetical protein
MTGMAMKATNSVLDQYIDKKMRLPSLETSRKIANHTYNDLDDKNLSQIKQFEKNNLELSHRITKQLEAAKDFEAFYRE